MVLINIDALALSIQSYICNPDSMTPTGESASGSGGHCDWYKFDNDSIDSSHYVVASNAVYADGTYYDLVMYPFKGTEKCKVLYARWDACTVGFRGADTGYMGCKLVVTRHGNRYSPVSWTGLIGCADLDENEYIVFPSSFTELHAGTNVRISTFSANNGKKYCGKSSNDNVNKKAIYDLHSVFGQLTIPTSGVTVYYSGGGSRAAMLAFDELKEYIENNAYAIDFDANGGSGAPDSIFKFGDDTSVVMGDISSTIPTRSLYAFRGWSASSSYSSDRIAYSSSSGGSADYGGTSARITSSSWTYDDYCTYTGGSSSSRTLTLYAQWERSQYVVTYHGNGSTGGYTSSQIFDRNSSVSISDNGFTKMGYLFTGEWKDSWGNVYKPGDIYSTNADLDLYAQWKPIKYYVMYHGNTNFNTSQGDYKHPETLTYDVDFTLLPTKFSRDVSQYPYMIDGRQMNRYKFLGWGLTPNQTYADYIDKQTVKNLTTVDGATVDLYAIWKQDLHLKFDLNGGEFD